jgi:cytochrome c
MGFGIASRNFSAIVLLGMLANGSVVASAQTVGDREAGWHLVRRWCAACHIVDDTGYGTAAAPALPMIARQRAGDRRWLRAWLAAPHPPMPNMKLSQSEMDDIVAYLDSLARP